MLLYLHKLNKEYLDRNIQDVDWDYEDELDKKKYYRDYEEWLDDLEDEDFKSNFLDK